MRQCILMIILTLCVSVSAKPKQYLPGELIVRGDLVSVTNCLADNGNLVDQVTVLSEGVFHLKISTEQNLVKVISQVNQLPNVQFAQPNYIITLESNKPPKDTFWLTQWALSNIGQDSPSGSQGRSGADIRAMEAWKIHKGSKDVVVAVIDTGIDYTHPDLKDNMWVNEAELKGIDGKDDDGNGYPDDKYGWNFITSGREKLYHGQLGHPDPMDDHSHGTHCAGIIGAKPNNHRGIAGLNWNVRLMALKFLSKEGMGSSIDAYRAILYAANNGADIMSNSWGGGAKDDLVQYAIEQAQEKGVLFVAAAGNSASNNDDSEQYPCGYPVSNVVSVAASDNKDQIATFSNYGAKSVHLAAPGVDIMSTIPVAMVERKKFAYASFSGTSMATPYVAGAAALLIAADPSLKGKPEKIKERLLSTVDVMPHLAGLVSSQGRLNVYNALKDRKNSIHQEMLVNSRSLDITAPRFNEEIFDKRWVIKEPGAEYMRLHFKWVISDIPQVDLIAVYDKSHRLIFRFEKQYPKGFWTPWIQGDEVIVRFANALVAVQKTEEKEFKSPDAGFREGAIACRTDPKTGKTFCYVPVLSEPYANFDSRGFEIDRLEYQKLEVKDEAKQD